MQREYLVFFKKPNAGDDFTFENYDVIARVKVPDIRYIYFCCQNTDVMWLNNPTTVKITDKNVRSMAVGDAFTSVDTLESWKIGIDTLPEPIKGG